MATILNSGEFNHNSVYNQYWQDDYLPDKETEPMFFSWHYINSVGLTAHRFRPLDDPDNEYCHLIDNSGILQYTLKKIKGSYLDDSQWELID